LIEFLTPQIIKKKLILFYIDIGSEKKIS
jgi:hypothetical protein